LGLVVSFGATILLQLFVLSLWTSTAATVVAAAALNTIYYALSRLF
jgi:hypothetical protein